MIDIKESALAVQQAASAILRSFESAQSNAHQLRKGAEQQHQQHVRTIHEARSKFQSKLQGLSVDIQTIRQEATGLSRDLKLQTQQTHTTVSSSPSSIPSAELDRLLQGQLRVAQEQLQELRKIANDLQSERKKWWKFW